MVIGAKEGPFMLCRTRLKRGQLLYFAYLLGSLLTISLTHSPFTSNWPLFRRVLHNIIGEWENAGAEELELLDRHRTQ
jgi:hypothetical protein